MIKNLPSGIKLPPNVNYIQGQAGVWQPEFESDFDKAIYYAGKSPNPRGKGQKEVVKWLTSLGLTSNDILGHRKKVLDKIRERTKRAGSWDEYPYVQIPTVPQSFTVNETSEEDIPSGLDDLLSSIQSETPKQQPQSQPQPTAKEAKKEDKEVSSAMSLYKGTRSTDLVGEQVDERILRILNLKETFDLDYGTYMSLLKEAIVTGKNKLQEDELALIANERSRVRGKVGRFKINKKRISSTGFTNYKKIAQGVQPALPAAGQTGMGTEKLMPEFDEIDKKLDDLIASVRAGVEQDKQEELTKRRKNQRETKRKREQLIESKESPVLRNLVARSKRIMSPFQAIIDRIFKFIGFTLLGFGVDKFFKWFTDPDNQKKIQVVGRFLKDFWPVLLGAATLFFTPLGGLVRGTVRLLRRFTPALLRLARANPIASAALAAGATTTILAILNQDQIEAQRKVLSQMEPEYKKRATKLSVPMNQLYTEGARGALSFNQGGMIPSLSMPSSASALIPESTPTVFGGGMSSASSMFSSRLGMGGGMVNMGGSPSTFSGKLGMGGGGLSALNSGAGLGLGGSKVTRGSGIDISGAGVDTQLIAAEPGEIVIPTETVNKYGANYFMKLIQSSGKSGIPRFVNNIQIAKDGGMVGHRFRTGRVMQPRSGGRGFGKTGNNQYTGQSQLEILGVPIPFTQRNEVFNQSDIDRYERVKKNPYGMTGLGPFQGAVNMINRAGQQRVESMRKHGYTGPVEYDRFLKRHPSLQKYMGPQSSMQPVGTPVYSSETKMIVLPTTTTVAEKKPAESKFGNDIPEFVTISSASHRAKVTAALGISALV